jgi:hypothetical protein
VGAAKQLDAVYQSFELSERIQGESNRPASCCRGSTPTVKVCCELLRYVEAIGENEDSHNEEVTEHVELAGTRGPFP